MTNDFPKVNPDTLCDTLKLCGIRKDSNDEILLAIKYANGNQKEVLAKGILMLDEYEQKKIVRSYSSGHVFYDADKDAVFLIEVDKNGTHHYQFTGGSPKEDELKNAVLEIDGVQKFDLSMVELNAEIRTKTRTGVKVISVSNDIPKVDRVLIEKIDNQTQENYWNLVCLMHYLVASYEGDLLPQIGKEGVIGGEWILLSDLEKRDDIAPNVSIISRSFINKDT